MQPLIAASFPELLGRTAVLSHAAKHAAAERVAPQLMYATYAGADAVVAARNGEGALRRTEGETHVGDTLSRALGAAESAADSPDSRRRRRSALGYTQSAGLAATKAGEGGQPAAYRWEDTTPVPPQFDEAAVSLRTPPAQQPSLHWGAAGEEMPDLGIAVTMGKVLEAAGMKAGEPPTATRFTTKRELAVMRHGSALAELFRDISALLREASRKPDEALDKVSQFLRQRQRKLQSGFLASAQSARAIKASLQLSRIRQQAETLIHTAHEQTERAVAVAHAVCLGPPPGQAEAEEAQASSSHGTACVRCNEPVARTGEEETRGEGEGKVTVDAEAVWTRGLAWHRACFTCHDCLLSLDPFAAEAEAWLEAEAVAEENDLGIHTGTGTGPGGAPGDPAEAGGEGPVDIYETPAAGGEGEGEVERLPRRSHAGFYVHDGDVRCAEHYREEARERVCAWCLEYPGEEEEVWRVCGRVWHKHHLGCTSCHRVMDPARERLYDVESEPWCEACYEKRYRTCARCGERVEGEDTVAMAMDRCWHARCFTCFGCERELSDGFYPHVPAERDGGPGSGPESVPYCLGCYGDRFCAACPQCREPVTSGGVEACGQTWHRDHFGCSVCGEAFEDGRFFQQDGKPFCHTHYLERYGVRCAACDEFIEEGELFEALGRKWHPDCFVCTSCGDAFPEGRFFEHDGLPFCEQHYAENFCDPCACGCGARTVGETLEVAGRRFLPGHLRCSVCANEIQVAFFDSDKPYCEDHYRQLHLRVCGGCGAALEGTFLSALDATWHTACFKCLYCDDPFPPDASVLAVQGVPFCEEHYRSLFLPHCAACGLVVESGARVRQLGDVTVHDECFTCGMCGKALAGAGTGGEASALLKWSQGFCTDCLTPLLADPCAGCMSPLVSGKVMEVLGHRFHQGCLVCAVCARPLKASGIYQRGEWPVCAEHARAVTTEQEERLRQRSKDLTRKIAKQGVEKGKLEEEGQRREAFAHKVRARQEEAAAAVRDKSDRIRRRTQEAAAARRSARGGSAGGEGGHPTEAPASAPAAGGKGNSRLARLRELRAKKKQRSASVA